MILIFDPPDRLAFPDVGLRVRLPRRRNSEKLFPAIRIECLAGYFTRRSIEVRRTIALRVPSTFELSIGHRWSVGGVTHPSFGGGAVERLDIVATIAALSDLAVRLLAARANSSEFS